MTRDDEKYWYNFTTGQVEKGYESPAIDRAGPFDTAEAAAGAPELLRERSRAWAEEDEREAADKASLAAEGDPNAYTRDNPMTDATLEERLGDGQ